MRFTRFLSGSANLPRGRDSQGGQARSVSGVSETDHLGGGSRSWRRGPGSWKEYTGSGRAEAELLVSDSGTRRR